MQQALQSQGLEMCKTPSNALCQDKGAFQSFLRKWNCDLQSRFAENVEKSHFGRYPTLSQLNKIFGDDAAITWLMPQLYNLSEYCGVRDKLQGRPLQECARVIATTYSWLKVSEVMLFLHRFKSGRYGRFYGSVDPLIITTSLRTFLDERTEAYTKREQQEREQREASAPKGITWEEYCRRHGIDRPSPLHYAEVEDIVDVID